MIAHALPLKPAIEDICSKKSLTVLYDMCCLKLKWEEWVLLEELSPLLGVHILMHIFCFCSHSHS